MVNAKDMAATLLAATLLGAFLATAVNASKCTPEQRDWQAQKFFDVNKDGWTACGTKAWMTRFNELAPEGDRILFDIGCNKGYESGLFFDLLAPVAGLSPASIYEVHQKSGLPLQGNLCGTCKNCEEKLDRGSGGSQHKSVQVYCFEPSQTNFVALSGAYARHQASLGSARAAWHLINAAMGNHTGLVRFPRECSSTMCSLHDLKDGEAGVGAAFITSVDDFSQAEGLRHIDVLKIDTEGNDVSVLWGASETLRAGKVGLVYFEYNWMGQWRTQKLEDAINRLDDLGYTCYFEGSPTLTRLTGCWSERFEFRKWSNVVCAHREHFMYPELEALAFVHEKHSRLQQPEGEAAAEGEQQQDRSSRRAAF